MINQSEKPVALLYYNIDWIKKETLPADTPYFYAQYRQEYPVKQGSDYVILDTQGKGHYVGTVLAVRSRSPSWFGEGDEKVYIDGEESPSIWGTGTEDYFLSAWGLQTTITPYFGTPQVEIAEKHRNPHCQRHQRCAGRCGSFPRRLRRGDLARRFHDDFAIVVGRIGHGEFLGKDRQGRQGEAGDRNRGACEGAYGHSGMLQRGPRGIIDRPQGKAGGKREGGVVCALRCGPRPTRPGGAVRA